MEIKLTEEEIVLLQTALEYDCESLEETIADNEHYEEMAESVKDWKDQLDAKDRLWEKLEALKGETK